MAYMFRQKLRLQDLAGIEQARKKVLVFEPEEYLAALYGHYLTLQELEVRHCLQIQDLRESLAGFRPHLLVFNAEPGRGFSERRAVLVDCKKFSPELLIVTTAFNAGSKDVSELMSAGVLSHINRSFSKPHDLGLVVKTLLYNN